MKMPSLNLSQPVEIAILLAVAAAVGYGIIRGAGAVAGKAADAAGGIVSGNNALTAGTPYEGTGVLGTAGAAANAASGGLLQAIGEWGSKTVYDWLNPGTDAVKQKVQVISGADQTASNKPFQSATSALVAAGRAAAKPDLRYAVVPYLRR